MADVLKEQYCGALMRQTNRNNAGLIAILIALVWAPQCGAQTASPQTDQPASAGSASSPAADAVQPAAPSETKPHDNSFVIGDDDMLAISVWKEPDVSRTVPVRSDGKISLPLVGEVIAAGRTPLQLEQDITAKLTNYMTEPEVTVIVQQINSEKYNILGQVGRPGSYPLILTTTVVDAIANAGGFKDFAKKKAVYVLRQNPTGGETRLNFNYQDFIKGKNTSQNIVLMPHDTIIVP
jgi:polysaccharide export outer membrane protein